ncbi:hypothetical protein Taro_031079 [Colocasia esculenta]|uniref:Uncharacterized protein n=1 Tax=Colocasia esculenta TaxID=4460 RepID=A0A843VP35_COLES|nr:hypothetical protein [Colocasia esculenta]
MPVLFCLVVTVTWDPQPRASVRGSSPGGGRAQVSDLEQKGKTVVEVLFRCGPASPSHCLALRWFRSRIGRSGVGPQFGQTVVVDRLGEWFHFTLLGWNALDRSLIMLHLS